MREYSLRTIRHGLAWRGRKAVRAVRGRRPVAVPVAGPTDASLVRALAARRWLADGRSIPVRVQSTELRRLRAKFPYRGAVLVQAGGSNPAWMWFDEDDLVAAVSFWFGPNAYESYSCELFARLSRDAGHVLDVGGHTGIYSLLAAASSPDVQVHYFEALARIAERARVNVAISGLTQRITLHAKGVSSSAGTLRLFHNDAQALATGSSFEVFAGRQAKPDAASSEVEVISLDDYWTSIGRPSVGLMKIDVERHEAEVIKGATAMLAQAQPVILAEVLSEQDYANLFAALGPLGYRTSWTVDDERRTAALVRDDLTHADGSGYEYSRYHNVLFATDRFSARVERLIR